MNISSINNLAAQAGVPADPGVPRAVNQDQRTLIQAVKAVNATEMFGQDNELTFFLDRNSRRAVVRIVNKKTREVVQQIPPEYVLRMAEEIKRS
jgi:flagellar protein FlaG